MNALEQSLARGVRTATSVSLRTFGRYEAHEEIGDGAMGRVYRGFDPMVGRVVAIKTVKSEYLTRETRVEYLRRFRREAQAAGRLAHPNIVSIFDVGEDYFVMEYVEGITLHELLRCRSLLDVHSALRLLAPVADALDFAHRSGVIHRDIKPSNIMVQPDGRPKLMDFGVARMETSAMTSSGQFFGSPSYMAPEQILGTDVGFPADLFSFAVVAYEAITGQRPFQGDSITTIIYRAVNETPAAPRSIVTELPPRFDEAFSRALCKQASGRYESALAFVSALSGEDLEMSLADLVPEPIPEAASARLPVGEMETQAIDPRPALRRRRLLWLVPAAALLALAVEIALLVGTSPVARRSEAAMMQGIGVPIMTEPTGATVWVDGAEVGQAPLTVRALAPGRHRVRVQHHGYGPAEVGFEVTPGVVPQPVDFKMVPMTAPLQVVSTPPGAAVRVDGVDVGFTPLDQLTLQPGRHEVRLEKKGFRTSVQRLEARPGEPLRVDTALAALPAAPRVQAGTVVSSAQAPATPVPVLEGMLLDRSQVNVPPRRIKGGPVPYPQEAKQLKLFGTVGVDVLIDETGQVADVRVLESAGAILDKAVIEAVRQWRFEPATRNGVKVKVHYPTQQSFLN